MSATTISLDVAGMRCGSCAEKIRAAILGVPGVASATVAHAAGRAEIVADAPVAMPALLDAIERVGEYRATPAAPAAPAAATVATIADEGDGQARERLFPLALIVGYLVGVTILASVALGRFEWQAMMRHFMAGFFLTFSFFKMLDLRGFVAAYRTYDLPARRFAAWAWAYPFVELGLGVAYLLDLWPVATNAATLAIMLVGAVGVTKALREKRAIRCACLGTALNLPMTKVTLFEDLIMAAMAMAMLAAMAV